MKKFFAATLIAALMSFGLVAVGGAANAACPYTGCFPTITDVKTKGNVKVGQKARIKVRVLAPQGFTARGVVTISITRKGGKFSLTRTTPYTGPSTVRLNTDKLLQRGKYAAKVTFTPAANSPLLGSSDSASFRVR